MNHPLVFGIVSTALACAALGSGAAEAAPLPGLGVCTHFSRRDYGWKVEKLLPQLQRMGASVIRDEISWGSVERQKGVFALPTDARQWFDQVTGSGIQVIVVLDYGNKLYENPLDPDRFADYAAYMARALKGRPVAAFEIWNEPGNFAFRPQYGGAWNGRDGAPWVDRFAELASKAAAAIHREDPSATVITGAGGPATLYLLRRHPEAFAQVDGLTEHPYTFRFPPETAPFGGPEGLARDGIVTTDDDHSMFSLFRRLREESRRQLGRELPLWVTEFGYTTYNATRKPGLYAGYSEEVQAEYHARALIQALAWGIKSWCLYDLMDDGTDRFDAENNFGLVRNEREGYAPKPALDAIRRVGVLLGKDFHILETAPATLEVPERPLPNNDYWQVPLSDPFVRVDAPQCHWFRTSDSTMAFLWKAGRHQDEYNPPLGNIRWPDAPNFTRVEVTNLVSGERLPARSRRDGNDLILEDLPVGAAPLAVRWLTSKE